MVLVGCWWCWCSCVVGGVDVGVGGLLVEVVLVKMLLFVMLLFLMFVMLL